MPKCHRMSLLQTAGPRRSLSLFLPPEKGGWPRWSLQALHMCLSPWDCVDLVMHVRQQCTGLWQARECCALMPPGGPEQEASMGRTWKNQPLLPGSSLEQPGWR